MGRVEKKVVYIISGINILYKEGREENLYSGYTVALTLAMPMKSTGERNKPRVM